jgi:hydroxymethylpyrimidine/phosphomethylpyrimidine kinase
MFSDTGKVEEAVERATMYTHLGIQEAEPIGHGHGPLSHFHNVTPKSLSR